MWMLGRLMLGIAIVIVEIVIIGVVKVILFFLNTSVLSMYRIARTMNTFPYGPTYRATFADIQVLKRVLNVLPHAAQQWHTGPSGAH